MKTILSITLIIMVMITACQKEKKVSGCTDPTAANYNLAANNNDGTCQYVCPTPWGACAAYNDTMLAYQQITGRWDLKKIDVTYIHGADSYCYRGASDYLEFLPNRTVNIHDSSGSVNTITYEFGVDDMFQGMYNKFRILDSFSVNKEYITVCDSSLIIKRTTMQFSRWSYYVKQ